MEREKKPKYSIAHCVGYMLRTAWHSCKQVIFLCLLIPVLELALSLAQLYLSPVIVGLIGASAPLKKLLSAIGIFAAVLAVLYGVKAYVNANTLYGQVLVRTQIIFAINHKTCVTSYPNIHDPQVSKLREQAFACTGSNSQATEHIWVTMTKLLTALLGFGAYLLLLAEMNVWIIAVVLLTSAAGFLVTNRISDWNYRHRGEEAAFQKQAFYLYDLMGDITLGKDIRIFGLKNWLDSVWESVIRTCEAFLVRREKRYLLANLVDVLLTLLRNGLAYGWLILLVVRKEITAVEFLLYFSAVGGFAAWINDILKECVSLKKECQDISTVLEYIRLPEQFRMEGGKPIPSGETWELALKNVTFRYPGSEKAIFRGLNLTIRPGERLAVVGLNGAGKSTIVKLLCGYYDPDEGSVLLNGTDIREFNRQEYYGLFSAVFQEYSHLEVTVAENVAQSMDEADRERVKTCLMQAGLWEAVEKLPKGADTPVGREVYLDGVLFSGGQMQRLMLARALYKNGQILVLDEPTAALDPLAESEIYRKYRDMTAGKTSLFISHRLASTRFCDRIIFLQDGRVQEEGTHEELLALGGGYAELFEVQSRYYREGRDFCEEA